MIRKHTVLFLSITVLLLAGIVIGAVVVQAQSGDTNRLSSLPAGEPYQATSSEQHLSDVYEHVIQSVVNVSVATRDGGSGTGSGFVIDTDGHIVTNNHVIENASYIEVSFNNGTIVEADLVGRDPDSDLAVIRVDPAEADLQPVTFADSDNVFIGQQTLAIGSPFNQDFTLTTGIVSALGRSLRNDNLFSIPELIQTDAAINPGNSGGPLLDMAGNVIGVNTAILSGTGTAAGIGFAIPSNTVRRVVPYLIANGTFVHSWLGISGTTLFPAQREAMNLGEDVTGVVVSEVVRRGPADAAGLRAATEGVNTPFGSLPIQGDIITSVNGEPIDTMTDLIAYLETDTLPGDTITLNVWRNGQTVSLPVTLEQRPAD
jgi:S1-C subfamily serine protease